VTTEQKCGTCGAPLPQGAPAGQCPECLLQLGLNAAAEPPNWLHETSAPLLRYIGDYELLEEIARGGMGVVFKARQVTLNRIVAIKMILAGHFAGRESIHRFRAEAEAAASLRHPNIVAIHEIGEHEGQQYFSMDYIEGRNLADVVRDNPMSPKRAAACIQTIAETIQYAHERGILHRDLKPSNILLDIFDAPHITDFGLAKRLTPDSQLTTRHSQITLSGQILGSPNYMPPEQASGKRGQISPASDVYSLGAILHHLLTGRAPFAAESVTDTLQQVLHNEPVSPRLLNPTVPRDLETICLKCLEKEPARRYSTARELAEELRRFQNGEPILARPISRLEKTWRWGRREPALATVGMFALLLFLTVIIGAPIAILRTNQARLDAERNLYAADMRLASQAVHDGTFNHAHELLEKHRPTNGAPDLRGFEWRYLSKAVRDSKPIRTFGGLPAKSGWETTALTRSGRYLYNEGSDDLRAWDLNTWEKIPIVLPPQPAPVEWRWDRVREAAYAIDHAQHILRIYALPHLDLVTTIQSPGPITNVTMSADRRRVSVCFREADLYRLLVWDLSGAKRIGTFGSFKAPVYAVAFSKDASLLAGAATNGVIGIWDLKTLESLPAPSKRQGGPVEYLAFTPDNDHLISNLKIWDLREKRGFSLEQDTGGGFDSHGFSSDDKYFIASWNSFDLILYDSRTLQIRGSLRGHRSGVSGIAFSHDGKLLASASIDQTARLWDLATQRQIGVIGGLGERISSVQFAPDDQNLILIGGFGKIRVYQLSSILERGVFARVLEAEGVIDLAISPDERRIATISAYAGTLTIWDRVNRTAIRTITFSRYLPSTYSRVAFSPDSKVLAWITGNALHISNVESGETELTPIDGNHEPNSISFSPDGGELAFGCGKQLLVRELASGQPHSFASTPDEVFAVQYSPDGTLIAFGDRQGTITLAERRTGKVLSKFDKVHAPHCYCVAWSPDGHLLASSGADSVIRIWEVSRSGLGPPNLLRGHMSYVNPITFSPDGTRLVSSSGDQTLKIWDPYRHAELATLYGHHQMVTTVQITKDGRTLYSGSLEADIRLWEAPPLSEFDKK
jgi:WD40 repeat protein/tRNA A-37 threonylcarbamoyl transferase component Bud32